MDFVLFILLNATLFIRPGEFLPALADVPLYEVLVLLCTAASMQSLFRRMEARTLRDEPVTFCVLGLLAAAVLSHLSHFALWGVRIALTEFTKPILYYFLAVVILNSTARMRTFLLWTTIFTFVIAAITVLHYHGIIQLPALSVLEDKARDEAGEETIVLRLRGTGIFGDPNDLCLILSMYVLVSIYWLKDRQYSLARPFFALVIGLLFYAIVLTQSRGGLLGLLAGLAVLATANFGWKKTALLGCLALPLLLFAVGGRQTEISTNEETGQERLQFWSDGLQLFREAPIFGIGQGLFADRVGLVAHNSFLHCFAELGFFGGTLFLGAFIAACLSLKRIAQDALLTGDSELIRLRPYLLAIIGAFATGILTLSRAYVIPTYLVLALPTAYGCIVSSSTGRVGLRLSPRLVVYFVVGGVAYLAAMYVIVRLFVHWNG